MYGPVHLLQTAVLALALQNSNGVRFARATPDGEEADAQPARVDRMYPILLCAGAELPAETHHSYIQKVIDAGGWARYERLHLDKLTAMHTPKPPTDGRSRSRRRLSPLRRLPPEVLRKIVAYAFHAGYY